MLKATQFEILRGVTPNYKVRHSIARRPLYVGALLNEPLFDADHWILHRQTIFIEDPMHDWDWDESGLRYYSVSFDVTDVLVVYETQEIRLDPMTGERLAAA